MSRKFFSTLHEALAKTRFFTLDGVNDSHPDHLVALFGAYQHQVILELAAEMLGGLDLQTAVQTALKWRGAFLTMWESCTDIPVVGIDGTARTAVLQRHPEIEIFLGGLAIHCVDQGWSNVNGGSSTGVMGAASRAWRMAIEESGKLNVRVLNVNLKFTTEVANPETPSSDYSSGYRSPPFSLFELRTAYLHAVGVRVGNVIMPGGFGTGEELNRELLSEQLAGFVHTHHSHRDFLPPLAFVSSYEGNKKPLWRHQEDLMDAMERIGTASRNQVAPIAFFEINPENAGEVAVKVFEFLKANQPQLA